eukprot:TRINITY_DN551_c0_g2_i2.p1 TRINITY_DN551_c0_g2~~TRINITY_DN551_c0_g2_i2.p1  ORF type:complete len:705 (-),score=121.62 TRINITY_DN551_c0_g2_i2:117-2231(-)
MAQVTQTVVGGDSTLVGALLFAASRGDVYGISELVHHRGAKVSEGDYDLRTALHLAASEGHVDAINHLISLGAAVNNADRYGNTPLDDAIRSRHDAAVDVLLKNGAVSGNNQSMEQALINAAGTGDVEEATRLIRAGVSVNCADYDGRTPLHLAASEGHLPMIDLLLLNGADINKTDRFGGTPLTDAMRHSARVGKDEVRERLEQGGASSRPHRRRGLFVPIFGTFQVIFIVLFGVFVRYDEALFSEEGDHDVDRLYPLYQDVHVMIFIGFGFLMTFLRKYGYSSIGYNMLIGAFVFQWYLLCEGFWSRAFNGNWDEYLHVEIMHLVLADFCAGSVLITFGALLGKVSPTQLLLVALCETVFFSINEAISLDLGVADVGGSMVIHTFGAYFGLAASMFLTPKAARGRSDNAANYRSDLFAMIGTVFLWMYWPSFNSAPATSDAAHRAIVNTVISLCGSCVSTFVASRLLRGEDVFNMVDIQNATLAGGVAIGAVSNMVVHPYGALIVGCVAGVVSVLGYVYVQPWLERRLGLYDTCGVHNLHGMPGVLSGVASAVVAGAASVERYHGEAHLFNTFAGREEWGRDAQQQAGVQIGFLGITLGIALVGGALTGYFVQFVEPATAFFSDGEFWEVPHLETPYYFDHRGEIIRTGEKEERKGGAPHIHHDVELQPLISPGTPQSAPDQVQLLLNKMDLVLNAIASKKG